MEERTLEIDGTEIFVTASGAVFLPQSQCLAAWIPRESMIQPQLFGEELTLRDQLLEPAHRYQASQVVILTDAMRHEVENALYPFPVDVSIVGRHGIDRLTLDEVQFAAVPALESVIQVVPSGSGEAPGMGAVWLTPFASGGPSRI